jgi:hypothetical protein
LRYERATADGLHKTTQQGLPPRGTSNNTGHSMVAILRRPKPAQGTLGGVATHGFRRCHLHRAARMDVYQASRCISSFLPGNDAMGATDRLCLELA